MKEHCKLCDNVSYYDKETLKASMFHINGINIILCSNCEQELKKVL